jgi:hypothetical protein
MTITAQPGTRRVAAIALIATPLAFSVFFSLLQSAFNYPAVLDASPATILHNFAAGGTPLTALWYGYMFAALLFIPTVLLVHQALAERGLPYLSLATGLGVVAGIVQVLGLARWVFLVPFLATTYQDPTASTATKEGALVVLGAFNHYAGSGLGEHLGYLLTGVWTLLIAVALVQTRLLPRWLGIIGTVLALGIIAGDGALLGITVAKTINSFSYLLWAVWLIIAGVFFWRGQRSQAA